MTEESLYLCPMWAMGFSNILVNDTNYKNHVKSVEDMSNLSKDKCMPFHLDALFGLRETATKDDIPETWTEDDDMIITCVDSNGEKGKWKATTSGGICVSQTTTSSPTSSASDTPTDPVPPPLEFDPEYEECASIQSRIDLLINNPMKGVSAEEWTRFHCDCCNRTPYTQPTSGDPLYLDDPNAAPCSDIDGIEHCGFAKFCGGTKYQKTASFYLRKRGYWEDAELQTLGREKIEEIFSCPVIGSFTFRYQPEGGKSGTGYKEMTEK